MLKTEIKKVLFSQNDAHNQMEYGIERELLSKINYTDQLITIISGIRRSGKSTLLRQIARKFQNSVIVNFEDPRLFSFELSDFTKLEEVIFEENSKVDAILFDEIQNISNWERYVRNGYDRGIKYILTGSNAHLLSVELGGKLTGRYLTFELFPFSFHEYCSKKDFIPDFDAFKNYFNEGGFPEFIEHQQVQYLQNIFRDILTRDIINRYDLRNHKTLFELASFIISNTGKEYSLRKLAKLLEVKSVNTVKDYIKYLEDSYLVQTISLYTHSIKRQIVNNNKSYCIDNRLVQENSLSFSEDLGRKLENLVFLELRRRNRTIHYYKEKTECDFVVSSLKLKPSLFQVVYELNDANIDCELIGLMNAMEDLNSQNGSILTFNQKDKVDGIEILPVWEWMQNQS